MLHDGGRRPFTRDVHVWRYRFFALDVTLTAMYGNIVISSARCQTMKKGNLPSLRGTLLATVVQSDRNLLKRAVFPRHVPAVPYTELTL